MVVKNSNKLLRLFPAFESRNYRYYFVGQLISQIGTWLQIVAQGWLVLQLTNSAFLVGLIAAITTLPSLLFSLFGGVLVDRMNKKKLILITQSLSMILPLILGVLTILNVVQVWHIGVLAFLLGVVNSIDMPARQAFVSEMVEKDKVTSAIALNAGIYNSARVIGPSLAGILIAIVGVGGAFILNGLSYIAAVVTLFFIIPFVQKTKAIHPHPLRSIQEGVIYTWTHPLIRSLIILTGIVSIFGWSYTTVMPLIAKNIFHEGAAGLGYLYAASGVGAILATLFISTFSQKISPLKIILYGTTLFALAMIGFSLTKNLYVAYAFLFVGGFGLLSAFSTMNAQIQHLSEEHVRGRVISVYLLMFVGLFPVGNFQIGFVAEHVGPQNAILVGSIVILVALAVGYILRRKVASAHEEYLTNKEITEGKREVMRDAR